MRVWVYVYTKSNGCHLHMLMFLSITIQLLLLFCKESRVDSFYSDRINCRTNDLWPFCMRCPIQLVLAKANSCQFFPSLSYRILFHCPLQRKSFNFFFTFSLYCLFFTLFLPNQMVFYAANIQIFKMLIYFTVAQTKQSDSKAMRALAHDSIRLNPFHFFMFWVLLVICCGLMKSHYKRHTKSRLKLPTRTKAIFSKLPIRFRAHLRVIDKNVTLYIHCLIANFSKFDWVENAVEKSNNSGLHANQMWQ